MDNIFNFYKRFARFTVLGSLISGFTILAGCSSVPDAVNPVEWYKGTVDFFSGEDDQAAEEGQAAAVPGADEQFPNLSAVPDRPPVAEGLAGDTPSQYAGGGIQRQGMPTNVLQRNPQPAPPPAVNAPVPNTSVTSASTPPPPAAYSPPPQVAFNQPAPVSPPANSASVEQTFRAGLAQQRPGDGPSILASAGALASGGESYRTVVVSSGGVELVEDGGQAVLSSRGPSGLRSSPARSTQFQAENLLPGNAVRVATILFPVGSARLGSRDKDILRKVYALHRQNGGNIRVIGHASSRTKNMDPVQHKMTNFNVSIERADIIAREFLRLGVKKDRIFIGARADEEPLYYEVMPSGEAGNRRAEVYLEY